MPQATERKVYKLHSIECPNRPSPDADQGRRGSNVSRKLKSDPSKQSRDKYCRFHRDHGHDTADCYNLKQ